MYEKDLAHWGIKGMRWGIRRYQNADGTLTAAGRARYGNAEDMSDSDLKKAIDRLKAEHEYNKYAKPNKYRMTERRIARDSASNYGRDSFAKQQIKNITSKIINRLVDSEISKALKEKEKKGLPEVDFDKMTPSEIRDASSTYENAAKLSRNFGFLTGLDITYKGREAADEAISILEEEEIKKTRMRIKGDD